jgi:hypothetical protein
MKIQRHKKLGELIELRWGISLKEYLECDDNDTININTGKKEKISTKEEVDSYIKSGFWGLVEVDTGVIHFWLDEKVVNKERFLYFLAHEIGHTKGKECWNMRKEELRANTYGDTILEAIKLFKEIFKNERI